MPTTKERKRQYQRTYYQNSANRAIRATSEYKASAAERQRKRNATPEGIAKNRERKLRAKYNIDRHQWETIFSLQGRICAICKSSDPRSPRGWSTDHNHTTGQVRGILCPLCNKALGLFKDNPENLIAAIVYLVTNRTTALRGE